MKKNFRGTMLDIFLNIAIPYAIYNIAHQYFGLSDVISLTLSAAYPIIDIIIEFSKDRTLNFISAIVLVGTIAGIVGALIGGDAKLILIRESFFTFILGVSCFISLGFGRPLMFYFAREFVAGKDSKKREEFFQLLKKKRFYDFMSLLTLVWGFVYVGEFVLKIFIVYTFSISQNLIIGPMITYVITFAVIGWTVWYGKKMQKASEKQK
jgi:hypothetical protein